MANVMDTLITDKMKKSDECRMASERLVAANTRINELDVLIDNNDDPSHPHRIELNYLVGRRPVLLAEYNSRVAELDALDAQANKEIEVHNAEVEKSARVLAGEEPLTTKETIGYTLCGTALVGSGLTFAYFVHGYLAYVFGL